MKAPALVAFLLGSRVAWYMMFGALFVVIACGERRVQGARPQHGGALCVSALMGVQVAPMIFVAQYMAGMGKTMSAAPVLGARS